MQPIQAPLFFIMGRKIDKPNFVFSFENGNHLSREPVTRILKRPTRRSASNLIPSYLALLQVGFSRHAGHPAPGELLPHLFTLPSVPKNQGGLLFCGTFPELPPLGVTQYPALWSSDFPQASPPAIA